MREESEGKTGGSEFGNSSRVPDKSRGVSSIEVADRPKIFLVTTGKRSTGTNAAGTLNNRAVKPEAQFHHRVGFVHILFGKQFTSRRAEVIAGRCHDALILFCAASDIEQAEQHSVRTDPEKVV